MFKSILYINALVGSALAGTVLWDGRFNEFTSSSDLNNWSWANQVGPYQYYIHGSGAVTSYVNLSPSYKNPADTVSKQGVKITIDSTAKWNSDMWRTELIPQTKAAINSGKVYYHFSMKRSSTNAPNPAYEHQVNFFESHFTEMKYGLISGASGTSDTNLRWYVGGQSKWNVVWDADVWHNIAYEIDFSANTVSFWHSTGSDPLKATAGPFSASTSSNGADWHLGVLRLPKSGDTSTAAEDWYYSGVYVESGTLTTAIGSGSSNPPAGASSSSSSVAKPTTTAVSPPASSAPAPAPATSSAAPTPGTIAMYGQCGGINWSGAGTCASGTCTVVNDYYWQCLPSK